MMSVVTDDALFNEHTGLPDGIYKKVGPDVCTHPQHNGPMHISVPSGCVYKHTCPGCGHVTWLEGNDISF